MPETPPTMASRVAAKQWVAAGRRPLAGVGARVVVVAGVVWCGVVCVVCCPPCMPARAGATGQTLLRSCAVDAVLGWGAIRDTGCCGHGSPTGAVCIPDTHAICASVGCCCEPGRQTQRRQVVLGRHRRQRLRHHKVPVRGASTGASLRLLCSILI